MGNFEDAIPKHLDDLERHMGKLRRKVWSIEAEFNHECDCEYCDIDPEPPSEEVQAEIDGLETEIIEVRKMMRSLKKHAQIHGIEVAK